MISNTLKRMLLPVAGAVMSLALAMPGVAAQKEKDPEGRARGAPTNKLYIVRMADPPAIAYEGGVAGIPRTKPGRGSKIDPDHPDVVRYTQYLESRHNEAAGRVGGRKVVTYKYTFNGFAAELTEAQVAALKANPAVLSIEKDEARLVDTSTTPSFLGINAPNGLWNLDGDAGKAGEDVVIGIVDSGIWPEHPSFSDNPDGGRKEYRTLRGWKAKCGKGSDRSWNASDCNKKLVSAAYYNAGWGGDEGVRTQIPWEYNSPRDYNGHGTHTASTAAGNANITVNNELAVWGKVSGMAHRARIAVYKSCFTNAEGLGSCFSSDSVAAIDQAVADGVDVINFSVSGSRTNFRDPVEIAFMFAADAGVFVATSAGNSGPTASSVAHGGPWLTTVAAGTHNRTGSGSATLGNGANYPGASITAALASKPLIDAAAAGLPGADPIALRRCYLPSDNLVGPAPGVPTPVLDPAKVAGKIVVCERGVNPRVSKSQAVKEAGGVGMILVNVSATENLVPDLHSVPSVHLPSANLAAIKAYAATAGATAQIAKGAVSLTEPAPFTAGFSSRGPLAAGGGDLLKPDIMAPGQGILAAVAPPGNGGRLFELYDGTSMSSPHIAGLAAVLKNLHPDWSPMMIKSALMTTAYDPLDAVTAAARIFNAGAGHVQPNKASDPGLVFDSGIADWLGFLCGTQLDPSYCTSQGIPVLDASNMNVPSIAIGDLAGFQTVTRTVTNVGGRSTYNVNLSGAPAGLAVTVNPGSFTLNRGESIQLTFTVTRTTATLGAYTGGFISWSDGRHTVRIPMVVRPVGLAAPVQVSESYPVKFGYTGGFAAAARGLVAATTSSGSVIGSNGADFDPGVSDGTWAAFPVTIPAGTTYTRFALFDADSPAGSDLDLYVTSGGAIVLASGGATAAEEINIGGNGGLSLIVYVHAFNAPAGGASFRLHTWHLPSTSAGNMTVTFPASATLGTTGTIGLAFPGPFMTGTKYLGSVAYGPSGVPLPAPTIVRIDR
jgi:hypothetical protein